MCGRYELHANPAAIALAFGLAHAPSVRPRYNVAPMQDVQAAVSAQIDHAFSRALLLIAAFFALLFAYRWATLRWLRPAA